jgi:hypothetical protein
MNMKNILVSYWWEVNGVILAQIYYFLAEVPNTDSIEEINMKVLSYMEKLVKPIISNTASYRFHWSNIVTL